MSNPYGHHIVFDVETYNKNRTLFCNRSMSDSVFVPINQINLPLRKTLLHIIKHAFKIGWLDTKQSICRQTDTVLGACVFMAMLALLLSVLFLMSLFAVGFKWDVALDIAVMFSISFSFMMVLFCQFDQGAK